MATASQSRCSAADPRRDSIVTTHVTTNVTFDVTCVVTTKCHHDGYANSAAPSRGLKHRDQSQTIKKNTLKSKNAKRPCIAAPAGVITDLPFADERGDPAQSLGNTAPYVVKPPLACNQAGFSPLESYTTELIHLEIKI